MNSQNVINKPKDNSEQYSNINNNKARSQKKKIILILIISIIVLIILVSLGLFIFNYYLEGIPAKIIKHRIVEEKLYSQKECSSSNECEFSCILTQGGLTFVSEDTKGNCAPTQNYDACKNSIHGCDTITIEEYFEENILPDKINEEKAENVYVIYQINKDDKSEIWSYNYNTEKKNLITEFENKGNIAQLSKGYGQLSDKIYYIDEIESGIWRVDIGGNKERVTNVIIGSPIKNEWNYNEFYIGSGGINMFLSYRATWDNEYSLFWKNLIDLNEQHDIVFSDKNQEFIPLHWSPGGWSLVMAWYDKNNPTIITEISQTDYKSIRKEDESIKYRQGGDINSKFKLDEGTKYIPYVSFTRGGSYLVVIEYENYYKEYEINNNNGEIVKEMKANKKPEEKRYNEHWVVYKEPETNDFYFFLISDLFWNAGMRTTDEQREWYKRKINFDKLPLDFNGGTIGDMEYYVYLTKNESNNLINLNIYRERRNMGRLKEINFENQKTIEKNKNNIWLVGILLDKGYEIERMNMEDFK